jgi:outer membrane protein TolC
MNQRLIEAIVRKTGASLRISAICLLLAELLPASARAQDPDTSGTWKQAEPIIVLPDSGRAVTEEKVIALALGRSRKFQSLATDVEIADHRLKSSGRPPNPELRIRNVSTRNYDEHFDELRIGLRIRIPELGELGEERERARTDLWEQNVEKIRYRQDLTARVRRDYADVLATDRLVELAGKKVSLLDRRIGMIEHLMQIGDRSVVYYMKAKTIRAGARNDYARAVQKQATARRQMVKLTGLGLDTPLVEESIPEPALDLDQAVQIATLNRPEIGFVRQEIELGRRQRNFERLKLLPWLNFIEFSYRRDKTRARDSREVSAGIDVPLFNWNIGNIQATNLAVRKREARVDAVLETIEEEVRSTYSAYRDLWLDWRNFSVSSETQIRDSENVISQSSVHGTLRSDEMLELEMTILETQQVRAEKKRDLSNALSELLFAMGVEKLQPLP